MTKNILILFAAALFLSAIHSPALSKEVDECLMCGMDLSQYTHVKYTVVDTNGKRYVTCGVQCGIILQLNLKDKFKAAVMTDLFSHKSLPAEKGWYVYKSSVITDMGPGLIGFSGKSQAEKFIKGFGGELLTYQQSVEKVKSGFK